MATCCCCPCYDLNALIECDAITIDGFNRIGPWINQSAYTGGCCWRGVFGADECPYTGPICHETPCSIVGFGNNTVNSKRGVEYYVYRGCLREVWIWRDFYSRRWAIENFMFDDTCRHQLGCGYFILTRWVDTAKIVKYHQSRQSTDGGTTWPPFLYTCPFEDCFTANQCQVVVQPANPQWKCDVCTCQTDWWRIKYFETLPTGTVTFQPNDNDPCDEAFLRCVPDRIPYAPQFGKITHFNTSNQCCGTGAFVTQTCECENFGGEDPTGVFICSVTTPGYVEIPPLCWTNPDAWSIEIGECE